MKKGTPYVSAIKIIFDMSAINIHCPLQMFQSTWNNISKLQLPSLPLLLFHFIWNHNSKGIVSPPFRPKVLWEFHFILCDTTLCEESVKVICCHKWIRWNNSNKKGIFWKCRFLIKFIYYYYFFNFDFFENFNFFEFTYIFLKIVDLFNFRFFILKRTFLKI